MPEPDGLCDPRVRAPDADRGRTVVSLLGKAGCRPAEITRHARLMSEQP
jgi:hypothetical protein